MKKKTLTVVPAADVGEGVGLRVPCNPERLVCQPTWQLFAYTDRTANVLPGWSYPNSELGGQSAYCKCRRSQRRSISRPWQPDGPVSRRQPPLPAIGHPATRGG